jgi:hypothetical protein
MVHLTFEVLRELGLALPDVVESTIHGAPSLKVGGKLLACVPVHKSAEPNSVVVRIDVDQRTALIKANPEIYYVTDHYVGYPTVLVRLSRIGRNELRDLLTLAWRFVSSKKPARTAAAKASRTAAGPKRHGRERPASGKARRRRQ